jgi:hypothetical protein
MLGYEFQIGPRASSGANEWAGRIGLSGRGELREKQSRFEVDMFKDPGKLFGIKCFPGCRSVTRIRGGL